MNYYMARFEDLIIEPEEQIRQLCNFLGIEFRNKMLEQRVINSTFIPDGNYVGQTGFDKKEIDRWKEHNQPWINWCLKSLGKKYLKAFDYVR